MSKNKKKTLLIVGGVGLAAVIVYLMTRPKASTTVTRMPVQPATSSPNLLTTGVSLLGSLLKSNSNAGSSAASSLSSVLGSLFGSSPAGVAASAPSLAGDGGGDSFTPSYTDPGSFFDSGGDPTQNFLA